MENPEPADLEDPDGDDREEEESHDDQEHSTVLEVCLLRRLVCHVLEDGGQVVGLAEVAGPIQERGDVLHAEAGVPEVVPHHAAVRGVDVEQGVAGEV